MTLMGEIVTTKARGIISPTTTLTDCSPSSPCEAKLTARRTHSGPFNVRASPVLLDVDRWPGGHRVGSTLLGPGWRAVRVTQFLTLGFGRPDSLRSIRQSER